MNRFRPRWFYNNLFFVEGHVLTRVSRIALKFLIRLIKLVWSLEKVSKQTFQFAAYLYKGWLRSLFLFELSVFLAFLIRSPSGCDQWFIRFFQNKTDMLDSLLWFLQKSHGFVWCCVTGVVLVHFSTWYPSLTKIICQLQNSIVRTCAEVQDLPWLSFGLSKAWVSVSWVEGFFFSLAWLKNFCVLDVFFF